MDAQYHLFIRKALQQVISNSITWMEKKSFNRGNKGINIFVDVDHEDIVIPDYLIEEFPDGLNLTLKSESGSIKTDVNGFATNLILDETPTDLYIPWDSILIYTDTTNNLSIDVVKLTCSWAFEGFFERQETEKLVGQDTTLRNAKELQEYIQQCEINAVNQVSDFAEGLSEGLEFEWEGLRDFLNSPEMKKITEKETKRRKRKKDRRKSREEVGRENNVIKLSSRRDNK